MRNDKLTPSFFSLNFGSCHNSLDAAAPSLVRNLLPPLDALYPSSDDPSNELDDKEPLGRISSGIHQLDFKQQD